MKILLTLLKVTTFLVFGSILALTIGAYLNLPLPLKPLVVLSGSMEPTVPVGSVVFVNKLPVSVAEASYKQGDIITFNQGGKNVSHRVVGVEEKNGEIFYKTKGDANREADQELVAAGNIVGRVSWSVPYVGKFVEFVKQPLGFFLLILIPTLLIIISEMLAIWDELKKRPSKYSGLDAIKPFAMFFMAAVFLSNSYAFFSDVAVSNANTFSSAESFEEGPNASLFLEPTEQNYNVGDSVALIVKVDTDGENVNVVQADLTYQTLNLQFVDVDFTGSSFGLDLTETGGAGAVSILVGDVSVVNGVHTVAIVNFTALAPGTAAVNFAGTSSVIKTPGAIDILGTTTGGSYTVNPTIVINEFVANPGTTFTTEWVEVYNAGSTSISLVGWDLVDSNPTVKDLDALGTINPGEYKVYENSDTWLNNGGDTVNLRNPAGFVVDSYTFGDMDNDESIGRTTDGTGAFQSCSTPTKGTSNNGSC